MNARPWKRVRFFAIYRAENDHGQWTVHVEPGGLQIDTFHVAGQPHLHPPGDYDHRIPMSARYAAHTVYEHLQREGDIRLRKLTQELTRS